MEDFKNYMQKKNIDELQIFLKNSSVDLLKTIAKRYKLPASTKRKELIIQDILRSVKDDRPFLDQDQPLHAMTIPQLRNKARQLNIDFSNLHKKQDLRLAIIQKMAQVRGDDGGNTKHTLTELEEKKLPFLKDLAKSYKIKVSKLSKKQLITSIMEAEMMGKVSVPSKGSQTHNLAKMRKNELIVLAEERGLATKGKKKEDLVKMLTTTTGEEGAVVIVATPSSTSSSSTDAPQKKAVAMEWSFPVTKDAQERMRKDRKLTVRMIRDLLTEHGITPSKGVTKREDLLTLLFKDVEPSTTTTTPAEVEAEIQVPEVPKPKSSPLKKKKKVVIQEPEEEEDIVSEEDIQAPSISVSPTVVTEEEGDDEIVSMDEIQTPFEPIALETLLEEPSEKQLQEELYRCLQFYEHPN